MQLIRGKSTNFFNSKNGELFSDDFRPSRSQQGSVQIANPAVFVYPLQN